MFSSPPLFATSSLRQIDAGRRWKLIIGQVTFDILVWRGLISNLYVHACTEAIDCPVLVGSPYIRRVCILPLIISLFIWENYQSGPACWRLVMLISLETRLNVVVVNDARKILRPIIVHAKRDQNPSVCNPVAVKYRTPCIDGYCHLRSLIATVLEWSNPKPHQTTPIVQLITMLRLG